MVKRVRERGAAFVERMWRGEAGVAGSVLNAVLIPGEVAFRVASSVRNAAFTRGMREVVRAPVPVVSVGNIAIGGAGKTPFSAFLARRLSTVGHRPALLHGGYADDEPALHRQLNPDIPVYVGRDRAASARAAAAEGATVLVLDDGFQHRRLARDIDLVLVAAETWTPTPRLLPRGPWREPPAALRRASAVVVTYRTSIDPHPVRAEVQRIAGSAPVWIARMLPERWVRPAAAIGEAREEPEAGARRPARGAHSRVPASAPEGPILVLAAVARPELFIDGARAAGARVTDVLTFRDHHAYTHEDVARIRSRAAGRPIVTTAKDWVKLAGLLPADEAWVLEQDVVLTDGEEELDRMLATLRRHDA